MKGKYIPFLILPIFLFTLFLFNPFIVRGVLLEEPVEDEEIYLEGWIDSFTCEAVDCGTTKGTKTQTLYAKVCEQTCPTVPFHAERTKKRWTGEYICEEGYGLEDSPSGTNQRSHSMQGPLCVKYETKYAIGAWVYSKGKLQWECPEQDRRYRFSYNPNMKGECVRKFPVEEIKSTREMEEVTQTFDKDVQYLMREKEGKCVRPYVKWVVSWKNEWARSQYNENMPLWVDTIDTNTCESVATDVREVDCEAELIPCDEEEVLGTEDKVEVVLAETSSTNNSLVYIVQAILALSSLASAIYFAKKYIF